MRYTRGIVLLCSAIDFNATVSQFHQKKGGKGHIKGEVQTSRRC